MTKHSYGSPIEEDDILEIQGQEYRLKPFGMDAFRASMRKAAEASDAAKLEGADRTDATYGLSIDMILQSVHDDDQARLMEHINRSVGPAMVSRIAADIMRGMTDVDPTQPESSSGGSSTTGADSTGGALAAPSTLPS